MPREKGTKKAIDPKEKLRLLKEDVAKKNAIAAKAQEKLKEEENRQFEKCTKELQSLLVKTGGDINDVVELIRLFSEQEISLPREIEKLRGEQLDFDSVNNKPADDSPVGNEAQKSDKELTANDK